MRRGFKSMRTLRGGDLAKSVLGGRGALRIAPDGKQLDQFIRFFSSFTKILFYLGGCQVTYSQQG